MGRLIRSACHALSNYRKARDMGKTGRSESADLGIARPEEGLGSWGSWGLLQIETFTHLVVDLLRGLGQCHSLLEDLSNLFKLLALLPIIEGSRHIDFFGGMWPVINRNHVLAKRDPESPKVSRLSIRHVGVKRRFRAHACESECYFSSWGMHRAAPVPQSCNDWKELLCDICMS